MADYTVMMTRKVNGEWETPIDLEATFAGLFYYKCEGLNTKGEPRAYTEEYAEAEQLRIWLPENVTRKPTDVVLQLLFKDDARQTSFDAFVDYVSGKRVRFWDSVRKRQAEMYLSGAVEVSEEALYGSTPYFVAKFPFTCLSGSTTVTEQINTL